MNPINNDTKDINEYFISLKKSYPKPYNKKTEPAHLVIEKTIDKYGEDYRMQDKAHPIKELNNRKKDNITIARKK